MSRAALLARPGPIARAAIVSGPAARAPEDRSPRGRDGYILVRPKSSNSPLRTPPRNACHSSGVNRRTAPSLSRLFLTPTVPPGRSDTSTQLPLAKLSELFTQVDPAAGRPVRLLAIRVPTF